MSYVQLLKSTVSLSLGSAFSLMLMVLLRESDGTGPTGLLMPLILWSLAVIVGGFIGRGSNVHEQISGLLANSTQAKNHPDFKPVTTMINRLWPIFLLTIAAVGLSPVVPQIPIVAAGFLLILGLSFRGQASAVQAIQWRDGIEFWIEKSSPFSKLKLIRMPGLRRAQES